MNYYDLFRSFLHLIENSMESLKSFQGLAYNILGFGINVGNISISVGAVIFGGGFIVLLGYYIAKWAIGLG